MQYLVLHTFRSFGKTLKKGDVVDESEIRTPSLRRAEGKIIPAVSSSTVPAEETAAEQVAAPSQDTEKESDTSAVDSTAAAEPQEEATEKAAEAKPQKKPLLSFRK